MTPPGAFLARTAADFLGDGRSLTARRNGVALFGAYASAVALLGVSGAIAVDGYDGFACCVGALVAWIPVLLLARPVHDTGGRTLGDVLCRRARHEFSVRVAATIATVTIAVFCLAAELSLAGTLLARLSGVRPAVTITAAGVLTIACVATAGLKGTTWIQVTKAALLLSACGVLTLLTVARYGLDPDTILGDAADASGSGAHFLTPGLRYGGQTPPPPPETLSGKLEFVSLALAAALGAAGLPQVMNRLFTTRAPRTSVIRALTLTGAFYAMLTVLGFAAAALIGHEELVSASPAGLTALPDLARELGTSVAGPTGGALLLVFLTIATMATVLAVTTSALLSASTSVAHDWFGQVFTMGRPKPGEQLLVARTATVVLGAAGIVLALPARIPTTLLTLPFTLAASTLLPAVALSLFWHRLNGPGVVAGIYGGLTATLTLTLFSPAVSGKVDSATGESLSLLPAGVDFAWFPLENPTVLALPAALLCAATATYLTRRNPGPSSAQEAALVRLADRGGAVADA